MTQLIRLHMVSTAADACIAVALAGTLFFDLPTDAARSQVTLYLLLTLTPFAIVTPFLGPAITRFAGSPTRVLAGTSWARAAFAIAIAAAPFAVLLYPASFGVLVAGRAYAITKRALVPVIVRDAGLMAANAQLSRAGTTAAALGGLTGSACLHLVGPVLALQLAAALHVAAAVLARRVPAEFVTDASTGHHSRPRPQWRAPFAAMAGLRLSTGLLLFTMAFVLRSPGASTLTFGSVAAAIPIGSFAGTFVSPRLRQARTDARLVLGACVSSSAVVVAGATILRHEVGMVISLAAVAVASSVGRHAYDSILQRETAAAERSDLFARCEAGLQAAWVAGALVPTVLVVAVPAAQLAVAALLAVLVIPVTARPSRGFCGIDDAQLYCTVKLLDSVAEFASPK